MARNVGRWFEYAKAKLNDTLGSANRELDELEAERAAEAADKPWLTSDDEAPSLDEVRAKIEARSASAGAEPPRPPVTTTPDGEPVTPSSWDPIPAPTAGAGAGGGGAGGAPAVPAAPGPEADAGDDGAAQPAAPSSSTADDLRSVAEAVEQSQAKLELEAQARRSAERLDQIRRELGVDAPPDPEG